MSADTQGISMETIQGLVDNRRRSRFQGMLDGTGGAANVDFFCTSDGISATFFDCHPTERLVVPSPPPQNPNRQAFLHFCLTSATELYGEHDRLLHRLEPSHCTIGFLETGSVMEVQYEADQPHREVCVFMDPALLIGLMRDGEDPGDRRGARTEAPFSVINRLPIDGAQSLLLRDLFVPTAYEGAIRDLYRESKLLELICATASRIGHRPSGSDIRLGRKDIASIHAAKDLLLQDIANPPSLKALANRAGTNEFKLKKGFKQLFGQTVYGMLHEVRLLEARRLIEQEGMRIQEAARWVGYKSPSHFSDIFKRRFGILPKRLNKEASN